MEEKIHFLRLTGVIPGKKQREFEQTFRFVFNQLSRNCLEHDLSLDVNFSSKYHFYSLWPSASALAVFMKSQEFQVLEGAYKALGTLDESTRGELIDIKVFRE